MNTPRVIMVVGDNESLDTQKRIIEILDKKYTPVVVIKNNHRSMLIEMAMCYQGFKARKRPNVNIVKEFELIQKKQSKLSKSDRDWVVKTFNNHFKEIT